MATAKVLVTVDGQGLALDQAGADAIGAFAGFAPISAQPQPGALENPAFGGRGDAVEDHPARIGEQHGVARARELLVQAVHFGAGDVQDLAQAFAAFQQAVMLKHGGGDGQRRVEVVVLQATQPGAGDGRVAARSVRRLLPTGDGENLLGMATEMIVVHVLIILPA
ncbi:hypothetical protein [Pseudomonas sp. 24 E 13]|nr:hypothetical protein [Pseudomonas sp. 24 E 13]